MQVGYMYSSLEPDLQYSETLKILEKKEVENSAILRKENTGIQDASNY
jgi:hypothetical protein